MKFGMPIARVLVRHNVKNGRVICPFVDSTWVQSLKRFWRGISKRRIHEDFLVSTSNFVGGGNRPRRIQLAKFQVYWSNTFGGVTLTVLQVKLDLRGLWGYFYACFCSWGLG